MWVIYLGRRWAPFSAAEAAKVDTARTVAIRDRKVHEAVIAGWGVWYEWEED